MTATVFILSKMDLDMPHARFAYNEGQFGHEEEERAALARRWAGENPYELPELAALPGRTAERTRRVRKHEGALLATSVTLDPQEGTVAPAHFELVEGQTYVFLYHEWKAKGRGRWAFEVIEGLHPLFAYSSDERAYGMALWRVEEKGTRQWRFVVAVPPERPSLRYQYQGDTRVYQALVLFLTAQFNRAAPVYWTQGEEQEQRIVYNTSYWTAEQEVGMGQVLFVSVPGATFLPVGEGSAARYVEADLLAIGSVGSGASPVRGRRMILDPRVGLLLIRAWALRIADQQGPRTTVGESALVVLDSYTSRVGGRHRRTPRMPLRRYLEGLGYDQEPEGDIVMLPAEVKAFEEACQRAKKRWFFAWELVELIDEVRGELLGATEDAGQCVARVDLPFTWLVLPGREDQPDVWSPVEEATDEEWAAFARLVSPPDQEGPPTYGQQWSQSALRLRFINEALERGSVRRGKRTDGFGWLLTAPGTAE